MELDRLSKSVLKAKISALGDEKLTAAFDAIYIKRMPISEYTALSHYMSLSTLRRKRLKICSLWNALKNDNMENG